MSKIVNRCCIEGLPFGGFIMKNDRLKFLKRMKGISLVVTMGLVTLFGFSCVRAHTRVDVRANTRIDEHAENGVLSSNKRAADSVPEWNDPSNPSQTGTDGNSVAYPEYKFKDYYNRYGHQGWWNGSYIAHLEGSESSSLLSQTYYGYDMSFSHYSGEAYRHGYACYGPGAIRGFNDSNGSGEYVVPVSAQCAGTTYSVINLTLLGNGRPIVFYDGNQDGVFTKKISFADGNLISTVSQFAFYNNPYIEEVDLSNCTALTTIEEGAFMNCTNLKRVILPSSVTRIGKNAFSGCTKLISTADKTMNLTNVSYIGPNAFKSCNNGDFTTIQFSNKLETLGAQAFYNCTNLQEITLVPSITNIGDEAFAQCTGMNNAKVYNTTLSIGEFSNCTTLRNVYLNDKIEKITERCFENANANKIYRVISTQTDDSSLNVEEGLPQSLKTIGDYAFYQSNIEKIVLPNSTKEIGEYAFGKCTTIKSIDLNIVEYIKAHAFDGITSKNFNTITIPQTLVNSRDEKGNIVKGIDEYAFANSLYLNTVTFENYDLGEYMFAGSTNLTTVNYNKLNQMTKVADGVFKDCTSFSDQQLFGSTAIKEIGNYAFYNTAYTAIDILGSVNHVGDYAFAYCSKLSSFTSNAGVLGQNVASYCDSLTTVIVNDINEATDDMITIGSDAFAHNASLSAVDLGNVPYLGSRMFGDCLALRTITIPATVKKMGEKIFERDTNLTKVIFENDFAGTDMFFDCTNLTEIEIPGFTHLDDYAFRNSSLEKVTIPSG